MDMNLKQCPFCWNNNAKAALVDITIDPDRVNKWAVVCPGCGSHGPIERSKEIAVKRWNIRDILNGAYNDLRHP
jgi:Lar family restriction alleviation protein